MVKPAAASAMHRPSLRRTRASRNGRRLLWFVYALFTSFHLDLTQWSGCCCYFFYLGYFWKVGVLSVSIHQQTFLTKVTRVACYPPATAIALCFGGSRGSPSWSYCEHCCLGFLRRWWPGRLSESPKSAQKVHYGYRFTFLRASQLIVFDRRTTYRFQIAPPWPLIGECPCSFELKQWASPCLDSPRFPTPSYSWTSNACAAGRLADWETLCYLQSLPVRWQSHLQIHSSRMAASSYNYLLAT